MNLRESLFRSLDRLSESSIIHNGKKFSNVKRFDDDKSANDFLEKNPSHGVLHADKGGVYVAHNKNKGVKHTYTAHNEETEHLDEISKDLAARAYHGFTAKGDEAYADKSPEGNKKYIETQRGRKAAIDKFHGNSKVPATGPRPANEETEHLDEVADKKWDESKEKWVSVKRPTFDPKKERGRASTPDQGQKRSDFDEEADLTKIDTKRLQSMVQMHKHYGQKDPASKAAADRGEAELKSRMKKEEVDLDEAVNEKQIKKDLDSGMSHDVVIGKHANKGTTNTDAIRKVIKQHAWDKRMKKESVEELDELSKNTVRSYYNKAGEQGSKIAGNIKVGGGDWSKDGKNTKTLAKRAAGRAMALKRRSGEVKMSEEVEGLAEARPSQAHPLAGHDYHKKSNDQLEYIRKDAHSAAEAMKDHNPTAENKYRDQASDASSVLHFRKTSGTPDWYKKKYGHMKESVDLDENVSNISDARLKFHVLNNVPHGSYGKTEMKAEHDRRKKTGGPEYNAIKPSMNEETLDEAKTNVYHQHMLKALGKTRLPKDHPYTSAVANNGDFVVHNNGKVVGRLPKGEHSIKEELEALVELSPELLGRYASRATKDAITSLRKITRSTDQSTAGPLIARANKREKGADMAIDKIRGNYNVKVHAKEESSLPPHLAKLIDPKTGNMKDPEKQKIYDDMMKRRQGMAKAKAKMAEETSSVAKDATVKSTKPNVTANTNTTTPYDVKPQRIKSAEFNKLHN